MRLNGFRKISLITHDGMLMTAEERDGHINVFTVIDDTNLMKLFSYLLN